MSQTKSVRTDVSILTFTTLQTKRVGILPACCNLSDHYSLRGPLEVGGLVQTDIKSPTASKLKTIMALSKRDSHATVRSQTSIPRYRVAAGHKETPPRGLCVTIG